MSAPGGTPGPRADGLADRLPVPLRPGRAVLDGWRNFLFRAATGAVPSYRDLEPGFIFVAAISGIGSGLAEILAQAGADPSSGPMLGECEVECFDGLAPDATYEVSGEITGLEHRRGATLGDFDLLTYVIRLASAGDPAVRDTPSAGATSGTTAASCRITLVLPRRP